MTGHKLPYRRPQAECCSRSAFVSCAGSEPLTPGSSWGKTASEDFVVSEDGVWYF